MCWFQIMTAVILVWHTIAGSDQHHIDHGATKESAIHNDTNPNPKYEYQIYIHCKLNNDLICFLHIQSPEPTLLHVYRYYRPDRKVRNNRWFPQCILYSNFLLAILDKLLQSFILVLVHNNVNFIIWSSINDCENCFFDTLHAFQIVFINFYSNQLQENSPYKKIEWKNKLSYYHKCSVAFTWEQFQKSLWTESATCIQILHFWNYYHIFMGGPLSWHNEATTNLLPFHRRHFQMHFLKWICTNFS